MNDSALCMQMLPRKENLHQPSLQELFRESMGGITIKQILKTFPHGFLDETLIISSWTRDGELVQCRPHVSITAMGWVDFIEVLIDIKLFLMLFKTFVVGVGFKRYRSIGPASISSIVDLGEGEMLVTGDREPATQLT